MGDGPQRYCAAGLPRVLLAANISWQSGEGAVADGANSVEARAGHSLRFAERRALADGDVGAVGLDDGADHYPGGNDSPGVRVGGKWHVARLCPRDLRRAAGRLVRGSVRGLLGVAGFPL